MNCRIYVVGVFIFITICVNVFSEKLVVSDSINLFESEYVVSVNLSEQMVWIYHNGDEIRRMVCSTGIRGNDNETPRGCFIINESGKKRGEWFYSEKYGAGARYWVYSNIPSGSVLHISGKTPARKEILIGLLHN